MDATDNTRIQSMDTESASERQKHLLRTATLKVGAVVRSGVDRGGRVAIKNVETGRQVGATRAERDMLEAFGEGAKAPEVLASLIVKGSAPPLREFYELVLKGVERGILVEADSPAPGRRPPLNYRFVLPGSLGVLLFLAAAGAAVYAVLTAGLLHPVTYGIVFDRVFLTYLPLPRSGYDYLVAYVSVSIALSAGYLLAGGVVRACDAEVYSPRWRWRSPVPHFTLDLLDVRMGGGGGEAIVALVRLVPLVALFAMAVLWMPYLAGLLLVGILWQTLPWRGYPVTRFLAGVTGRIPPDTHRDLLFDRSRRTWHGFKRRLAAENRRFLGLLGFAWLMWAAFGGSVLLLFLPETVERGTSALLSPVFLASVAALVTLLPVGLAMRAGVHNARLALRRNRLERSARRRKEARLAPYGKDRPPPQDRILAMLEESIVFSEIRPDDRALIAGQLSPHFLGARETVISAEGPRDCVYVVFKGELEVLRELPSGRLLRLATLGHGDTFGTIPLWTEPPRRRIIRTRTPAIVYSLSMEDFAASVISDESREAIRDAVKASFLSRIPFFCRWPRETIRKFARTGSFVSCSTGKYVTRQQQPNGFFYIVYDGVAERIVNGRRRARLAIGEFFGEISMMRGTPAAEDVYCREDARFLVFSRVDFVRFLCEHPEAALDFERLCSKRLGHPVFPASNKGSRR